MTCLSTSSTTKLKSFDKNTMEKTENKDLQKFLNISTDSIIMNSFSTKHFDRTSTSGSIFVANIPPMITKENLLTEVLKFGKVLDIHFNDSKRWKFASILFSSEKEADEAVTRLHKKYIFHGHAKHKLVCCRCVEDFPKFSRICNNKGNDNISASSSSTMLSNNNTTSSSNSDTEKDQLSYLDFISKKTSFSLLKDGPPGANLFVYGIPKTWRELELIKLVGQYGHIVGIRVPSPQKGILSDLSINRGFGFVSYNCQKAAVEAYTELNGSTLFDKTLKIQPKHGEEYMLWKDMYNVLLNPPQPFKNNSTTSSNNQVNAENHKQSKKNNLVKKIQRSYSSFVNKNDNNIALPVDVNSSEIRCYNSDFGQLCLSSNKDQTSNLFQNNENHLNQYSNDKIQRANSQIAYPNIDLNNVLNETKSLQSTKSSKPSGLNFLDILNEIDNYNIKSSKSNNNSSIPNKRYNSFAHELNTRIESVNNSQLNYIFSPTFISNKQSSLKLFPNSSQQSSNSLNHSYYSQRINDLPENSLNNFYNKSNNIIKGVHNNLNLNIFNDINNIASNEYEQQQQNTLSNLETESFLKDFTNDKISKKYNSLFFTSHDKASISTTPSFPSKDLFDSDFNSSSSFLDFLKLSSAYSDPNNSLDPLFDNHLPNNNINMPQTFSEFDLFSNNSNNNNYSLLPEPVSYYDNKLPENLDSYPINFDSYNFKDFYSYENNSIY